MLLDEQESIPKVELDDTTLKRKKILAYLWIVCGLIGFLFGMGLLILILEDGPSSQKSRIVLGCTFFSLTLISCFLSFIGIRAKGILEEVISQEDMDRIPRLESYFWALFSVYMIWMYLLVEYRLV